VDEQKKKISVMIPCYNEEENVVQIYKAVKEQLETNLPSYDYEILFIDNNSTDNTRALLRTVCNDDKKVKAIFNAKNFGQFNSPYYAMCQTTGDCTICMCCDFQDPPELIPQFVKEWENGYKIVSGIKAKSKENPFVRLLRTIYYKMIKKMSDVEQIEHFTGFGLYDKSFIKVLSDLNDPIPFIRGIVAELGYKRKDIMYEQQKRAAGKTHNNWYSLYDAAMLSFTSYTKIGLRIATIAGFLMSFASFSIAVIYLILKLIFWYSFPVGIAPLIILVSIIGSVQLFFIGLLGEYILNINKRLMNRPLVIEEERINFDTE
jgi:Glycosyltransferases involved in cell wall biogenesis